MSGIWPAFIICWLAAAHFAQGCLVFVLPHPWRDEDGGEK